MTLLARFLLVLSICLMALRLASGLFKALAARRLRRSGAAAVGGSMVRDPVCGMYLDPRLGLRHASQPLYFCSDECRRKFLEKR